MRARKRMEGRKRESILWSIFLTVFLTTAGCSPGKPQKGAETEKEREEIGIAMAENLVLSREDYTVKYKGGTISLSRDGGETYEKHLYIGEKYLGHIHVFENGTLFWADHTKCYFSHDWKTVNESIVLDGEGEVFAPYRYYNFSINMGGDTYRHVIDGHEILCWGNYDYQFDTQYNNVNVWYTADHGETVKIAYKFRGTEVDDGSGNLYTRHVHNVNFNPVDQTFWLQTGDHIRNGVDQRHVIRGAYDLEKDEWEWSLVGTGLAYKWASAVFIGDHIYFSLDHSEGGVGRVRYDEADDETKHKLVLATPNDCLVVIKSHDDEILVIQAPYGGTDDSRNLYYSRDREKWHRIENRIPRNAVNVAFLPDLSTDNWGRVRATPVVMFPVHEVLPAIFLDEIVRKAGFHDAFRPVSAGPMDHE